MSPILPITATARRPAEKPQPKQTLRVLVTGSRGVIGNIIGRALGSSHHLIGLDLRDGQRAAGYAEVHVGSADDPKLVSRLIAGVDVVVHGATGGGGGWNGLLASEVNGTKTLLEQLTPGALTRFVLLSSNHVVGWHELDQTAGASQAGQYSVHDVPRPDGLYAVAKITAEALVRLASEERGLRSSVLRIGTMRSVDNPEVLADDPNFAYLGDSSAVAARMHRTWLYHDDFLAILAEELAADETFRLRFATSDSRESPWGSEVLCWDPPVVT